MLVPDGCATPGESRKPSLLFVFIAGTCENEAGAARKNLSKKNEAGLKRRQYCERPASLALKMLTFGGRMSSKMINLHKPHFHAAIRTSGVIYRALLDLGLMRTWD
jgi:hypothetical protein